MNWKCILAWGLCVAPASADDASSQPASAAKKPNIVFFLVDISEKHDLAGEQPQRVKQMARQLGEYLRNVQALMPLDKATGKPLPWPDEA